jgi:crotonobetainyl-CoA:carnitine CoA-transferase CaiB-like acyl-CoA transferase
MRQADILIESSRGGTFREFGLSDEVLWEANLSLVIVHLSGFGQEGIPEYTCWPIPDRVRTWCAIKAPPAASADACR